MRQIDPRFSLVSLLTLLALLVLAPAHAETKPPTPFGVAAQQSAPPAFTAPSAAPLRAKGPFGSLLSWVAQTQQRMQRELASTIKQLKSGNALAAGFLLAGLSFVYGVVHAIGPGHGKAIISSYVIANEETVRRGVLISFLAAALQAVTAVALISILILALNATGFEINAWAAQLETVSYALVALLGLYLLTTGLVRLWRQWREPEAAHHTHHGHGDHGHHDHHHHRHDHDDGCDHIVDARELVGPVSWRKMLAVVVSVGIRPCSGAILVLVFALAQGLFWAGVAATFAMALGTAITVAVLATLALGSRELAIRLGGENSRWVEAVWTTCTIGGALVVLLLGGLLFAASLGPARPF